MTSDKLQQLFKMLEREPRDTFLLYGIGMEYKKLSDDKQAIDYFSKVIAIDPNYCYAYYQMGQAHERAGAIDEARQAFQNGVEAAARAKDSKARDELQAALDMLS